MQPSNQPQSSIAKSKKQCRSIYQSVFVVVLLITAYLLITSQLSKYESQYWNWAYYVSPIFIVTLILVSIVYIVIAEDQDNKEFFTKDPSKLEENYFALNILLGISLMLVPLFISLYFGVFHDIMSIKQTPINGTLQEANSIQFQNENYTVLLYNFNLDGQNITGYGCRSNQENNLIGTQPLPYKFYTMEQFEFKTISRIQKLPSWLCTKTNKDKNLFYTKIGNPVIPQIKPFELDDNYYLITHQDPPYIPENAFAFIIATLYQGIWILFSILVYLVILYHTSEKDFTLDSQANDYKENEPQISENGSMQNDLVQKARQQLSGKKRLSLTLFAFFDLSFQLYFTFQINEHQVNLRYISYALMFVPAVVLMIIVTFKQVVGFVRNCSSNSIFSKLLLFCLTIVLSPIYFALVLVVCFSITNFLLFFSRVFVTYFSQTVDEKSLQEKQFNGIVNKFYLFQQIIRGPIFLVIIYNAWSYSYQVYIYQVFCLIQTILCFVVFFNLILRQQGFEHSLTLIYVGKNSKKQLVKIKHQIAQSTQLEMSIFNKQTQQT